jgi:hypothetical protein
MLVYRSTVATATFAGALLVGCTAPDQPTDLRIDGPPNVTTVTVMSDLRTSVDPVTPGLGGRLIESATFCRLGDEKRPGLVGLPDISTTQVCPDEIDAPSKTQGSAEGAPPNWFARVVFDKLLDPTVEDLIPQLDAMMKPTGVMLGTLVNTQPVTLKCNGVDVAYNGYYVPNGNRISWPLGPALFVAPLSAVGVPTGATCEVGIKDMVHNKDGESVPTDQRSYTFKIAPMTLRFSSPDPTDDDPGKIELAAKSPVKFYWTAAFTTMPDPTQIKIFEAPNTAAHDADTSICDTGGAAVLSTDIVTAPNGTGATTTALIMNLSVKTADPMVSWKPDTTYRVEFVANGAKITPKQGGADGTFPGPADYKLCFHTPAPAM